MRKKLKKIFNNKIFMFIFGGMLFSAVSVYAVTYFPSNQVTYDNSSSKLSSTNVQGAIDELYNTCKAATSGKYMYYTTSNLIDTDLNIRGYSVLYRCNIDGSNCNVIFSGSQPIFIDSISATSNYLYYTTSNLLYSNSNVRGYSVLHRCNIDGSDCNEIVSGGQNIFIDSISATSNYLYYTTSNLLYSNRSARGYSVLHRCNIDGSDCNKIVSGSQNMLINAIG